MFRLIILFLFLTLCSCGKQNHNFELCGIGITKPYYVTGLDYKGEFYAIEKEFLKYFKPPLTNNTGIAKIRFQVNCHGESGVFKYEEYNLDYRQTELNDSIELQIRAITKSLDQWIPGENYAGEKINSFKFLSFRIIDGTITEILPK